MDQSEIVVGGYYLFGNADTPNSVVCRVNKITEQLISYTVFNRKGKKITSECYNMPTKLFLQANLSRVQPKENVDETNLGNNLQR